MAERQHQQCEHSVIANLEKDCVRCREEGNCQQMRDQLATVKQLNEKLHLEVESAKRETMEHKDECEVLRQEMRAKSSQVKQYAKEVDRLKKAVSL